MVSAEVWSRKVRDRSCGPTDGRTEDRTAGPVLAFCGTMDRTSAGLDQGPVLRLVPDWTTETLSPEHLNALLDAFPIESIKTISVISNTHDVGEVKLPAHVQLASIHVQSSPGIMSSLLQALQRTSSTLSLTAATLLPFQITSTSWVSFVVGISTFQNLSSLVLDYPASFELANDPCKPFSLWVSVEQVDTFHVLFLLHPAVSLYSLLLVIPIT
jgi:hypothetical protein